MNPETTTAGPTSRSETTAAPDATSTRAETQGPQIATHATFCTCATCWPLPEVRRVGDLTARHIGRRIKVGSQKGELLRIGDYRIPGRVWLQLSTISSPFPVDLACSVLP